MQFEECLGEKTPIFFLQGFPFVRCRLSDNQNVPITKNCPCPEKISFCTTDQSVLIFLRH